MKEATINQHKRKLSAKQKRVGFIILFFILTVLSLLIGVGKDVNLMNLIKLDSEAWQILGMSRLARTLAIILTASGLVECICLLSR